MPVIADKDSKLWIRARGPHSLHNSHSRQFPQTITKIYHFSGYTTQEMRYLYPMMGRMSTAATNTKGRGPDIFSDLPAISVTEIIIAMPKMQTSFKGHCKTSGEKSLSRSRCFHSWTHPKCPRQHSTAQDDRTTTSWKDWHHRRSRCKNHYLFW